MSTSLSRETAAIAVISFVVCVYGTYLIWSQVEASPPSHSNSPEPNLHRSNAVHRRRRRTNTGPHTDGRTNPQADQPIFIDDIRNHDDGDNAAGRALTDGETVVDDQDFQEEFGWTNMPQTYERNGQNIVQLLFRVSEDATRRNAYVHRGCGCNCCGVVPIRGIRYHCSNCADYDLCEGCESQGLHTKTHIFYKIRVPAPSFGPKHFQPVTYSGDPDRAMSILPREITTRLSRETGFERPELDAYWEQWTFMATTDWRDDPDDIGLAMDRKTFQRCLVPSGGYRHSTPSLIYDRMFAFYDTNKDDLIGFPEFLHGIAYRKKKDNWPKIFEGYDIDGDGYVDRRDFLRMFRSYYVLYRQMHRDMLEGMEEQQMSTIDAHQLVNGRQPLSSAFGLDGRYPRAPDLRAGEGKTVRPNGDLEVTDSKRVLNESGNDTANREDIFRREGLAMGTTGWNRGDINNRAYWAALLDPPQTAERLPDLISNLNSARATATETLVRDGPISNAHPALLEALEYDDDCESTESSYLTGSELENDQVWPPNYVTVTDEDAEAVDGPGSSLASLRRSSRRAAITNAVLRERSQRDVHERWKRRRFYTDEEEGASQPAGWKEDDDVLANAGIAGESSKRPSVHSRSSSKVRFAEDMDDFDTRSNPSSSSRSVPERWGGTEIPDAEKDAGKEILYQVTQQAFNELLDPLFKEKEDLAVQAARNKADLETYRDMYSTPEFNRWAERNEVMIQIKKNEEEEAKMDLPTPIWPDFPEVEVGDLRDRPLDELLAATGYGIGRAAQSHMPELAEIQRSEHPHEGSEEERIDREDIHQNSGDNIHGSGEATERSQYDAVRQPVRSSTQSTHPQATPLGSDWSSTSSHRDPTLPQFRPNAVTMPESITLIPEQVFNNSPTPPAISCDYIGSSPPKVTLKAPASSSSLPKIPDNETPPTKEKLYILWKCDKAIKIAEEEGGWGRLGYKEFEKKVKQFVMDGKGNQMDYLGSWIEFCIP